MWRRFMAPALQPTPALEFPEPHQPAVFSTWERGPSALSYDPYYVAPETTESTATATSGAKDGGKDRAAGGSASAGAGRSSNR
jgi:hypothetical protein